MIPSRLPFHKVGTKEIPTIIIEAGDKIPSGIHIG
jgi:hypothetical protein